MPPLSSHLTYRWYPRSRGVYPGGAGGCGGARGSSPLARGLQREHHHDRPSLRIIPARAGFTALMGVSYRRWWDHPRSRGVYLERAIVPAIVTGSSPLARGLHTAATGDNPTRRIIPARAGFTQDSRTSAGAPQDHPRSRGVYSPSPHVLIDAVGSSPLARGLHIGVDAAEVVLGIIPARAGFTRRCAHGGRVQRDHPRSRGVYGESKDEGPEVGGSSPLARGLPDVALPPRLDEGIIPARAGFTADAATTPPSQTDHPRSRGVYADPFRVGLWPVGSSPLARGLLQRDRSRNVESRIIPARAGFTRSRRTGPASSRDHPRSRGVYFSMRRVFPFAAGSSPLARGLRKQFGSPVSK